MVDCTQAVKVVALVSYDCCLIRLDDRFDIYALLDYISLRRWCIQSCFERLLPHVAVRLYVMQACVDGGLCAVHVCAAQGHLHRGLYAYLGGTSQCH